MDTLQSMRVFRHIVELGSFTKASEFMGISTAAASKHVRHLEHHIHAKLLNRTSRRISLTESGDEYYRRCVTALDTLDDAAMLAQQGTLKPQGLLKITAPVWCATPHFAGILADYRRQYPDVSLSMHIDSRHTDLVAEGIDLALRITSNPEPNLIVKPLTEVHFFWVATPEYVAAKGMPESPADMIALDGLLPTYVAPNLPVRAAAVSNDGLMLYQMALNGMGIAYMPEWVIEEDVKNNRLVCLLPESVSSRHTLYAAYMDREFLSAKVRSLIDFLAIRLQASDCPMLKNANRLLKAEMEQHHDKKGQT